MGIQGTKSGLLAAAVAIQLLLAGCGEKKPEAAAKTAKEYLTFKVGEQDVQTYKDYPAVIKGQEDVEIRPKVDGYIQSVAVDEGDFVRKGQLLFRIDNAQYEQDLRNAKAEVEVAEAAVAAAELQLERTQPLVSKEIIGDYTLKNAEIELKAKQAQLNQAKARLTNAQVNVGYLSVQSPSEGVVGELPLKRGSYVSSNMAQPLTTISNIQTVFAYFSITESSYFQFQQGAQGNSFDAKLNNFQPVSLLLADGSEYPHKGKVQSISGQVNSSTGSFSVRAEFANPASLLRSGGSGKVRIFESAQNQLVVPQKSTFELQGKRMVYKVADGGEVKSQEIQVREVPGGQLFIVEKGISKGEELVLEGVGTLRDGTKIIPKLSPMEGSTNIPQN